MQSGSNYEAYSASAIFSAILKKWILIVLVTILCALLGLGYSAIFIRPTYTASRSVILRLSVGDLKANTVTTNVSLAKIYLPTVKGFVSSPAVIAKANEIYDGEGSISIGSISVPDGDSDSDSLIFSISYTDMDMESAEKKLDTIIESVMIVDEEKHVIETEDFSLIPTQRNCTFSVNNKFTSYIFLGAGAGLVISVLVVLILYFMDNTVVSKEEFEETMGVDVLANIKKLK